MNKSKEPMKISYLSTFYPYRGGIAQFNALLYRAFEKENSIDAWTFTRQYPDLFFPGKCQYVSEDDRADPIDSYRCLDTINPISWYRTAHKLISSGTELLVMKFWMPYFAPSLGYISGRVKRSGAKTIAILDNAIPHETRPLDLFFTKYFLKNTSGFVVMSRTVEKDLLELYPKARYIFHEHPIYEQFGEKLNKSEARSILDLPQDAKLVMFFGFIRAYKGIDLAIEAISKLPEDYHLIIAGEPYEDFSSYEKSIIKLGIENRVHKFTRYIKDEEVRQLFSASDVCLLPYKTATQSGIVGIAFNFDLPVIATDVGSLKEMIEPHSTGMIVTKPDVNEICVSLRKYFENNLSETFSENIKIVKQTITWSSLAEKIVEFSKEL